MGPQAPHPGGHGRAGVGDAYRGGVRAGPGPRRAAAESVARPISLIERAIADGDYAGERWATATAVTIVRKQPGQAGFAVQPRRWVLERTFAWLGRNRHLARDLEATIAPATAFLYAASTMLLTRRADVPREFRD